MRRRSNLDFEKRRRSRKTGYRRRKAKKKGFGNLPKAKKKIHLNLEMIASTFTWIFKILVTSLVAFVAGGTDHTCDDVSEAAFST